MKKGIALLVVAMVMLQPEMAALGRVLLSAMTLAAGAALLPFLWEKRRS